MTKLSATNGFGDLNEDDVHAAIIEHVESHLNLDLPTRQ